MATIADISGQPTEIAREIHRLPMFDGKAWPMYNDYGDNTGPTKMIPVDLGAVSVGASAVTLQTEETWVGRVLGGKFYVPFIDPRGDATVGQLAVATDTASWSVLSNVTPVPEHVFDVAETVDGLWLFGASGGSTATIWRSTDHGATWTSSLAVAGSGFARFYAAVQFGDTILAKFYDDLTSTARVYRWNSGGSSWALGANPVAATDVFGPFTFEGTPFALGMATDKNTGNVVGNSPQLIIRAEDAALAATITAAIPTNHLYDGCAAGDAFYLLTATQDVLVGDDTGSWSALLTLSDDTVRSIAVDTDAGYFGFGTTDGRVLRTPIPT